ncbi:hypothetical protein CEXT_778321 [Caerostris extrusa]|uniref:Uncharacterized protein n=1 Tax=Caerostris extrusa TaxID=172846 RepID=A0AAV4R5J9_CAEEX|nr:hypothetical protein CEXT_778321 [Caerostris extrusa]
MDHPPVPIATVIAQTGTVLAMDTHWNRRSGARRTEGSFSNVCGSKHSYLTTFLSTLPHPSPVPRTSREGEVRTSWVHAVPRRGQCLLE